jgi:hypothetical protein
MMLDFICELERVLGKWPENTPWTLAQVADATGAAVPQVVDILSDTLDRELEVHESLTHAEALQALTSLKERMATELAARAKRMEQRREKAMRSYDVTMEKVRVLQTAKNWRSAYKTLSYYVGCHEKDVPADLLLSLCGECLRLGIKAEANLQELSQWLRKGIAACLAAGSPAATEDAMDFLDAFGDYFVEDTSERGRRLIGNVLETVKAQALTHNLIPRFDLLVKDLRIS